eukprot:scaffold19972_cov128-Isochrysis_galbana.AAC.9
MSAPVGLFKGSVFTGARQPLRRRENSFRRPTRGRDGTPSPMVSGRLARLDDPEVEGVSYVDPRATFILHRHSGRAPELKTLSYYKRSWKSGKAGSVIPVSRAVAVSAPPPALAASAVSFTALVATLPGMRCPLAAVLACWMCSWRMPALTIIPAPPAPAGVGRH